MDTMIELYFVVLVIAGLLAYWLIKNIILGTLFVRAGDIAHKAFIPFYNSFATHKLVFGNDKKYYWFLNILYPYNCYQRFMWVKAWHKSNALAIVAMFFPVLCNLILVCIEPELKFKSCSHLSDI
jgi:hypothetical protein